MNANNNFTVIGFVANDAEIKNVGNSQVARTAIVVSTTRNEKRTSAFLNIEIWRKTKTQDFDLLKKGKLIKVSGFMKTEEWESNGQKHNRIVFQVTEVAEHTKEQDAETDAAEPAETQEA